LAMLWKDFHRWNQQKINVNVIHLCDILLHRFRVRYCDYRSITPTTKK
jgi:hypothetical protein